MHIDKLYTDNIPLVKRKAVEGDALFQLILGIMCYYGDGVFKDREKAHYWIHKSAENGNETAIALGECSDSTAFYKVILEHIDDLPFVKVDKDAKYKNKRRVNLRKLIRVHYGKNIIEHLFHSIARLVNPKYAISRNKLSFDFFTKGFVILLLVCLLLLFLVNF